MSGGVGVVCRRLHRSDRFPHAFKTHQEISPRSGILVFAALVEKNFVPGWPTSDDRQPSRPGARPVFGTSRSCSESQSRSRRAFDSSTTGAAARNCKGENSFLNL